MGLWARSKPKCHVLKSDYRSPLSYLCPWDFNLWRWLREANTIERRIYYLQFWRWVGVPRHTGPHGEHQVWSGGRKEQEESAGQYLYWVFCRKGKAEQNKQLKLISFNISGWLWVTGVVSSCLVPGLGMLQSRGIRLGTWELDKGGGWGIWAQDLLVCILKLCSWVKCYL